MKQMLLATEAANSAARWRQFSCRLGMVPNVEQFLSSDALKGAKVRSCRRRSDITAGCTSL